MIGKENKPEIIIDGKVWQVEGFKVSSLNHLYLSLYSPEEKRYSNVHINSHYNKKDNVFTNILKKINI